MEQETQFNPHPEHQQEQPPPSSIDQTTNDNKTQRKKKPKDSLTKSLSFPRQNTPANLIRIPPTHRIQKRPIPRHPPTASPHADAATAPKIVYMGTRTPFMSAVKRVQKILRVAEKRAIAGCAAAARSNNKKAKGKGKGGGGGGMTTAADMVRIREKLKEEKVYVRATGRAMERALQLGKWFEERGKGGHGNGDGKGDEEYEVSVKTGSVCVVDDIVPVEREDREDGDEGEEKKGGDAMDASSGDGDKTEAVESKNQRRRRRKRLRRLQEQRSLLENGVPESRTRWVKMVEVAINLKY